MRFPNRSDVCPGPFRAPSGIERGATFWRTLPPAKWLFATLFILSVGVGIVYNWENLSRHDGLNWSLKSAAPIEPWSVDITTRGTRVDTKVWGPQTNDLVLQLRKYHMSRIVLGGMLANMCVESHLRDLLEQGFEVSVVSDATAGPRHPVWGDGYKAAMINYAFLAHAVVTTDDVVAAMK